MNRIVHRTVWLLSAGLLATALPLATGCKKDPAPAAAAPATVPPPAASPDKPTAGEATGPAAAPNPTPAPVAEPIPTVPATPTPADPAAPPTAPTDPATTGARTPSPAPTYTRRAGSVPAKALPAATVKAAGQQAKDGVVYLSFPGGDVPKEGGDQLQLRVLGERYGLAVFAASTDGTASNRIIVRVTGGQAPPEKLELDVAGGPSRATWRTFKPWQRQTLTVTDAAAAPTSTSLEKEFFVALARNFDELAWDNPFYAFARGRATLLADGPKPTAELLAGQQGRSDVSEMMSLYSGLTSMEEALQADRGLRVRSEDNAKRTIAIEDVVPVPVASHDWTTLLAGKQPKLEPLASAVPADKLYLHFHDLRTAVYLGRELDEWLTPVLPLLDWRSGPTHMVERYQTQLVLERTALSEALGNLAAEGVAVVIGDPFIREGTDISVVFKVKDRALLVASLARFEANARTANPQLLDSTYDVKGRSVRRISTADRTIDQHRLEMNDLLIVSNSKAAIEQFVAIADGAEKPLAQSGDFQYMRVQFPFDNAVEDGFLFLSDAFVGKAVSPKARILESRRVAAQADLRTPGYAALLYGLLEGKAPAAVADLHRVGVLDESELKHADGGAITLDLEKGASSETWGRTTFMPPLSELTIAKVSEAEKAAYDRFRETYQNYWRSFIDPVGVRIDVDPAAGKIAFDTKILPLIDGTDYTQLREWAGDAHYAPAKTAGVVQWTFGLGSESSLRKDLNQVGAFLGDKAPKFDWLGSYCFAGFGSAGGLVDALLLSKEVPEIDGERPDNSKDWAVILDRLPFYAGVEVSNPLALAATLAGIRAFIETAAPGIVAWSSGGKYRDVPVTVVTASLTEFVRDGKASADLFYAIAKNVLVMALDKGVLEGQIDAILDGTAATVALDKGGAQADLHVVPGDLPWLRQVALLGAEREAVRQWLRAHRDAELLQRAFGTYPNGEAGKARALAFLGYEPIVLQGGELVLDGGGLKHSIYGTLAEPNLPEVPVAGSPLGRLIETLTSLDMAVGFEGEGNSAAMRVSGSWVRNLGK